MSKQLLETRLSIVMLRENLNFLTTIKVFQFHLKKYFKEEYSLDEIENALHQLEENYICNQAEEEEQIKSVLLGEMEEDFNI